MAEDITAAVGRNRWLAALGALAAAAGCCTPLAAAGPAWAARAKLRRGPLLNGGAAAPSPRQVRHAPIVARRPRPRYSGPVYVVGSDGALLPYVPSSTVAQLAATAGAAAVPSQLAETAKPKLEVPGDLAVIVDGLAAAPEQAPEAVKKMIWAANEIVGLPYIYGGGHASFKSPGYDCSGTVSYALHGGGRLRRPEDSSEFESYGAKGPGTWVTIFANPEHAYVDIAGLRLDTSPVEDPSNLQGPRWRPLRATNAGFVIRHPVGL